MPPRQITHFFLGAILLITSISAAADPTYIDVDRAVVNFSALQPGQQAVAALVLTVKPGIHAESHTPTDPASIKFETLAASDPALSLYEPVYPVGQNKSYASSGNQPLNVYTGQVTVYLPFQVKEDAKAGPIKIQGTIKYQACSDDVCFPPASTPFTIETKVVPVGEKVEAENAELFKGLDPTIFSHLASQSSAATPAPAVQKFFGFELKNNSYLLAFVAAFIAGIIFNAVPCVLPVLPLKAIGFYEVSQHNRARCLAFGAVFSLGLIASFAVLALFIVVKQKFGWGEIYSNIWFNIAIVLILLVMAIGTFGAFTVNIPVGIYNITPRHDTYLGNFLFGILTAILSTPCTFGLFVALLVWAATQPPSIGVALVMTVGAGMASPYFLLSAFPELARKFPRTGPWSELVKQMMSFLLLGSAVFFARRFIQPFTGRDMYWWTLFAVAAIAGVFLVARALAISSNPTPRLVAFVIAALMVGGTFWVVNDLAHPPYAWIPYSPQALESAQKSNRVVVIDFTATWCSTCQYLESHTLHSKEVIAEVRNKKVEMIQADLTSSNAVGWPLLRQTADFTAIPLTLVYGPGIREPQKLNGIYTSDQLIKAIDRAGNISVARE